MEEERDESNISENMDIPPPPSDTLPLHSIPQTTLVDQNSNENEIALTEVETEIIDKSPESPKKEEEEFVIVEKEHLEEEKEEEIIVPRFEDLQPQTVDAFGFYLDSEKIKNHSFQIEHDRKLESKWVDYLSNWKESIVKKEEDIKELCRLGIPISVRSKVWQYCSGSELKQVPGLYQELLQKPHIDIYEIIERDIHRCYPDHFFFRDKQALGQHDLFNILKAYAHYNPAVGYCQGMGRLVGLMLMQMPAEQSFWLLVCTIDKYLYDYYTPNLDRVRIHSMIFEFLLDKYISRVSKHLQKNDISPLIYTTNWFMTLFTMVLPWQTVLRVWDMFYFEGVKVIFRTALAIMDIIKGKLLKLNQTDLLDFLIHLPSDAFEPDNLVKHALNFKISRKEIQKLEERAKEIWSQEGAPTRGTLSLLKNKK